MPQYFRGPTKILKKYRFCYLQGPNGTSFYNCKIFYISQINSNPWLFVYNKNKTINPTNVATIQTCDDSNDLVTSCRAVNLNVPDPAAVDEVTLPGFEGTNVKLQSSPGLNPDPDSKTFVSEDGGQAIFTLLMRKDGKKQSP